MRSQSTVDGGRVDPRKSPASRMACTGNVPHRKPPRALGLILASKLPEHRAKILQTFDGESQCSVPSATLREADFCRHRAFCSGEWEEPTVRMALEVEEKLQKYVDSLRQTGTSRLPDSVPAPPPPMMDRVFPVTPQEKIVIPT